MEIRLLKANEIDLKPQVVSEKGVRLVPYKDARADMRILDETFGVFNWQREHVMINNTLYCTVSVWDENKKQWIHKQDAGTESYTEKEKGAASDAFKRACVNLGIGRELYTAPDIWIPLKPNEFYLDSKTQKPKLSNYTKFQVASISYNSSREIDSLIIVDQNGQVRYRMNNIIENISTPPTPSEPGISEVVASALTEDFGAKPTLAPTYPQGYGDKLDNMVMYHKEPYGNLDIQPPVNTAHYNAVNNELEKALNTIVPFGQYKGRTLGEIKNENMPYITWIEQKTTSPYLKNACQVVKANS